MLINHIKEIIDELQLTGVVIPERSEECDQLIQMLLPVMKHLSERGDPTTIGFEKMLQPGAGRPGAGNTRESDEKPCQDLCQHAHSRAAES